MLQAILEHIHNYFISAPNPGSYVIADGVISPSPSFKEGQRIWIVGSDLNDGVYTYHEAGLRDDDDNEAVGLRDEKFAGSLCALAVPPAVIALSAEISQWVEKYGDVMNSPYQSENVIGVYSYSKEQSYAGSAKPYKTGSWQDVFASRLNRWRKVAI